MRRLIIAKQPSGALETMSCIRPNITSSNIGRSDRPARPQPMAPQSAANGQASGMPKKALGVMPSTPTIAIIAAPKIRRGLGPDWLQSVRFLRLESGLAKAYSPPCAGVGVSRITGGSASDACAAAGTGSATAAATGSVTAWRAGTARAAGAGAPVSGGTTSGTSAAGKGSTISGGTIIRT